MCSLFLLISDINIVTGTALMWADLLTADDRTVACRFDGGYTGQPAAGLHLRPAVCRFAGQQPGPPLGAVEEDAR